MTQRKWNKGPPPSKNWYNASFLRIPTSWRWWDGEQWSATLDAETKFPAEDMEWTAYWPPDSGPDTRNIPEDKK